jgi:S-adenosylmethionine-diacylglycerol 3-amino-3-carboxypropyl transferase
MALAIQARVTIPGDDGPIQERASFAGLRYANCWEDADVLARGLTPVQGARCLSIASGGDNTFSLVARGAARVLAVDLSPAQVALVALKGAAFRRLEHAELLAFLGVRPARDRRAVYGAIRPWLDAASRAYWDRHPREIDAGVVHAGRLEAYFRLFRRWVLPLVHRRAVVEAAFAPRSRDERLAFYREVWDTWRWRGACRAFFSRPAMGRLGRDPEFFRHARGPVAARVLDRARHAFTALAPEGNPYLRYILTGTFADALPDYLLPARHEAIREGLDRLELRRGPVEAVLATLPSRSIDAFNLSDIAEYMDLGAYHRLLEEIRRVAAPGARLAYWNLLATRRRPAAMGEWLEAREGEAAGLHAQARAFFYERLVLEVAR